LIVDIPRQVEQDNILCQETRKSGKSSPAEQ